MFKASKLTETVVRKAKVIHDMCDFTCLYVFVDTGGNKIDGYNFIGPKYVDRIYILLLALTLTITHEFQCVLKLVFVYTGCCAFRFTVYVNNVVAGKRGYQKSHLRDHMLREHKDKTDVKEPIICIEVKNDVTPSSRCIGEKHTNTDERATSKLQIC